MNGHQWAMIAVMALTVIGLRALPNLLFGGRRQIPELLHYLGQVLTAAAIAMLVVYSLNGELDIPHFGWSRVPAAAVSAALTALLHCFFRNPLISIIAGTACFMVLVQNFC